MLFRALLISALSHLAILLSLYGFEPPNVPSSAPENQLLSMTLRQAKGWELPARNALGAEASRGKTRFADRRSGERSGKYTAEPSVLPPFPPSTAAIAKSRQIDDSAALEAMPAEPPAASMEAVKEYRLNVARTSRQFKNYPPLARKQGWEGVVLVAVAMPLAAGAPTVSLGRSSGYEVLDRQALDMVEQAVGLAVLPDGMRDRRLKISLPVEYRLAD